MRKESYPYRLPRCLFPSQCQAHCGRHLGCPLLAPSSISRLKSKGKDDAANLVYLALSGRWLVSLFSLDLTVLVRWPTYLIIREMVFYRDDYLIQPCVVILTYCPPYICDSVVRFPRYRHRCLNELNAWRA